MIELIVVGEGPAEETFFRDVVGPDPHPRSIST